MRKSTIAELFGIKPLDEEFINELLKAYDKLNLELPDIYNSYIHFGVLDNSNKDSISFTNVIIYELMDGISRLFIEDLKNYIKENNKQDIKNLDEIEVNNFINALDSHYVIYINGEDYWINEFIDEYIQADRDSAIELIYDDFIKYLNQYK